MERTIDEVVQQAEAMAESRMRQTRKYPSHTWIDVFAGCGTAMRRILSYLDEMELFCLESSSIEGVTPDVTKPQWARLDRIDRSRINPKWRQPHPNEDVRDSDHRPARLRGIEFASNALYARNRSLEASWYFCYGDRQTNDGEIPVRKFSQRSSMPPCWREWTPVEEFAGVVSNPEDREARFVDVFLDLSFLRDPSHGLPSERLSWRGFRRARWKGHQKTLSLQLDLEAVAEELGWTELVQYRNQSRDYAFTHYEVEASQEQLEGFMRTIEVTLHQPGDAGGIFLSERDPLLLVATGGYAPPAWSQRGTHMVFARNANIGRFHGRNGRHPLERRGSTTTTKPDNDDDPCWRSTFLRIPTPNSPDQSLGIILRV